MRQRITLAAAEWCVVVILIVLFFWVSQLGPGSYSAQKAHELSEKSYHYGLPKL